MKINQRSRKTATSQERQFIRWRPLLNRNKLWRIDYQECGISTSATFLTWFTYTFKASPLCILIGKTILKPWPPALVLPWLPLHESDPDFGRRTTAQLSGLLKANSTTFLKGQSCALWKSHRKLFFAEKSPLKTSGVQF
jgi:hypothetical protein